jgi:hypothetical protein
MSFQSQESLSTGRDRRRRCAHLRRRSQHSQWPSTFTMGAMGKVGKAMETCSSEDIFPKFVTNRGGTRMDERGR